MAYEGIATAKAENAEPMSLIKIREAHKELDEIKSVLLDIQDRLDLVLEPPENKVSSASPDKAEPSDRLIGQLTRLVDHIQDISEHVQNIKVRIRI